MSEEKVEMSKMDQAPGNRNLYLRYRIGSTEATADARIWTIPNPPTEVTGKYITDSIQSISVIGNYQVELFHPELKGYVAADSDFVFPFPMTDKTCVIDVLLTAKEGYLGTMENVSPAGKHWADPGPLGLASFVVPTLVLSLIKAEIIEGHSITLLIALAFFMGGVGQFIIGLIELFKNNLFGAMTFGSFGWFWMVFAFVNVAPKITWLELEGPHEFRGGMSAFLAYYLALTIFITALSWRFKKALSVALALLAGMIFCVLIGEWYSVWNNIGGWLGLCCLIPMCLYVLVADISNEVGVFRKLPVGACGKKAAAGPTRFYHDVRALAAFNASTAEKRF